MSSDAPTHASTAASDIGSPGVIRRRGPFVTAQQPHGTGRDDLGVLPALGQGAEYGQALDDAEACCGLSYVPCGTRH
jgi:hypothetical protein